MPAARRVSSSRRADLVGSHAPRSRSQEPSNRTSRNDDFVTITREDDENAEGDSQRVASVRDSSIRRAMSDPFDDGGDDASHGASKVTSEQKGSDLTTLPRFPVVETRNLNCWSEPSVEIFHVRGANYLVDKKKVSSGPYILRTRGCDLFLTEDPPTNIGANPSILGGALRKLPTFIVNFRFPWGVLVLYFQIPDKFCRFLQDNGSPPAATSTEEMTAGERAFSRFLMADDSKKNGALKLIPYIAEGPWVVRSMVTGKPCLIGNKLPVTYSQEPARDGMAAYLEADLDVGNSSSTARQIVSLCRRYMNSLTIDIGLVIQGNSEDELPEQMLGSIRIHGPDPVKASSI